MIVLEILNRRGEVVASHSSINLFKIIFDLGGFTVYTTKRDQKHYPYADGYQFRTH